MTPLPPATRPVPARRARYADRPATPADTLLAAEVPVAVEVNGIGHAVMMASPADLDDFALGFALAEGLVDGPGDLVDTHAVAAGGGIVLRLTLPAALALRAADRARTRLSESSCGLCGLDSIERILRPLPSLPPPAGIDRAAIGRAVAALRGHQPLGQATRATHAAAFCAADGAIRLVREDVGRHNALDKLVGAVTRAGLEPADGFFLLSARCSYELVEKTVRAGCPLLVTVSAATGLAARRAQDCGLTLATTARDDAMLVLNDPHGRLA